MNKEQTPELQGKTITDENGVRYFVMGNTRTRITEYFKEDGPTLTDVLERRYDIKLAKKCVRNKILPVSVLKRAQGGIF